MIRFSTEAANADVLGDDTPLATDDATAPRGAVARRSADRPEHRRGRQSDERQRQDPAAPAGGNDPSSAKPS